MLYLDTSALVKLVRKEPESDALADWLDDRRPVPWVASALVEVELVRALRRSAPELVTRAAGVIARLARYEIDAVVRAAAAAYTDPTLRALDAIHLATASTVFGTQLTAFVTYDQRLAECAQADGLAVAAPR